MRRFAHHLNTILNVLFAVLAVALLVLGVLSLASGPSLRYVPYMAGICALYYLATAVKVFMQGERKRLFRRLKYHCLLSTAWHRCPCLLNTIENLR